MSNRLKFLSQNLDILVARDVGFDFTSWICQQTVSLAVFLSYMTGNLPGVASIVSRNLGCLSFKPLNGGSDRPLVNILPLVNARQSARWRWYRLTEPRLPFIKPLNGGFR
jgi:hypothetical protein